MANPNSVVFEEQTSLIIAVGSYGCNDLLLADNNDVGEKANAVEKQLDNARVMAAAMMALPSSLLPIIVLLIIFMMMLCVRKKLRPLFSAPQWPFLALWPKKGPKFVTIIDEWLCANILSPL